MEQSVLNSQTQGMDEVQQRSVIRFMMMQKKTPKSIYEETQTTLGKAALAYLMVKKWAAFFKAGRESVEDDERSGRPTTAVNEDKVKTVEDFMRDNDRQTCLRETHRSRHGLVCRIRQHYHIRTTPHIQGFGALGAPHAHTRGKTSSERNIHRNIEPLQCRHRKF